MMTNTCQAIINLKSFYADKDHFIMLSDSNRYELFASVKNKYASTVYESQIDYSFSINTAHIFSSYFDGVHRVSKGEFRIFIPSFSSEISCQENKWSLPIPLKESARIGRYLEMIKFI